MNYNHDYDAIINEAYEKIKQGCYYMFRFYKRDVDLKTLKPIVIQRFIKKPPNRLINPECNFLKDEGENKEEISDENLLAGVSLGILLLIEVQIDWDNEIFKVLEMKNIKY